MQSSYNDVKFPEDTPVLVRYPLTRDQERGDRSAWPWLPGTIVEQCGPDEWQVCVVVDELARNQNGEPWFPCCFRDSSELVRQQS